MKQNTKGNNIKAGLMITTKLIRFNDLSLSLDDINSDVTTFFYKTFLSLVIDFLKPIQS
jgi:hypothetical protein